jgi:hypothetical protein
MFYFTALVPIVLIRVYHLPQLYTDHWQKPDIIKPGNWRGCSTKQAFKTLATIASNKHNNDDELVLVVAKALTSSLLEIYQAL